MVAQLERPPNQNSRNRKAKTSALHCGGRRESTSPKLVQRHGNKSPWMCVGEAFQLQHQCKKNHCQTEQNVSLANIAAHYIPQPMAGVTYKVELFHRVMEDTVWIARSESSHETLFDNQ